MKFILLTFAACCSLLAQGGFTQQMEKVKDQIAAQDYNLAAMTLIGIRRQIADYKTQQMDFSIIRDKAPTATVAGLLGAIEEAQARYLAKDKDATVRALDVARILSSSLYRKAPPVE